MNPRPSVKRTYRSPLRAAHAQTTRERVIDAAATLFIEVGYGATSIDAIAEAAGVGRATVFTAVGGKAALLKAAYDVAVVGDDEPVPLPQRPWAQHVLATKDPYERIARYGEMIADLGERVAPIYEAFRGAARADPEVRALWTEIRDERRGGASNFVRFISDVGALRADIDAVTAADVVWVLNDPALYYQLVIEQGWSRDKFAPWIGETMQFQLLGRVKKRRS
jgi:AcrR family transcriptional regulator